MPSNRLVHSSINWKDSLQYFNLHFLCDILVTVPTQQSSRTKMFRKKKRFSRVGKIARIQFLSKRYFKLTRRHFSSYNQPYLNVMSENALISHYRYKAVRSFCFETFKHRLYPSATTKTSYGITGECKSFKRRQLFSVLCFTGARLIRYSNFQAELHLHLHVNLRLQCTATSLQWPLLLFQQQQQQQQQSLLCSWYKKCKDIKRK